MTLRPFLLTSGGFATPNPVHVADTILLTDCLLVWWERFFSGTIFLWSLEQTQSFWMFIGICSGKSISSWKAARSIIRRFVLIFSSREPVRSTLLFQVALLIQGVLKRLNCFIPFLLIILCTKDCEIFNPSAIPFGRTWVLGWSSWEQITSSMASSF